MLYKSPRQIKQLEAMIKVPAVESEVAHDNRNHLTTHANMSSKHSSLVTALHTNGSRLANRHLIT